MKYVKAVKGLKPIVSAEQWDANNNASVLIKRIKSHPTKWASKKT